MQTDIQRDRARNHRKTMPPAERILWSRLRNRGLEGHRFHRQVEIGPYIVDFLCREKRVVVEVDGVTHSDASEVRADQRRTAYLQEKGFVVFRCWNADIYSNLTGVLEGLASTLQNRTR